MSHPEFAHGHVTSALPFSGQFCDAFITLLFFRISPKAFEEKIASEAMQPKVSISQADDDDDKDDEKNINGDRLVDQEDQQQVKRNGDTVISSQLLGVF